jgi:hypothetical protein
MIADVAKHRERSVEAGEVRLRLLDDAAQILEDLPIAIDEPADLGLERSTTKAAPPGHANAFEVLPERRPELRGSSWIERGLRGSGPAIALRNSATSATVRAIGPLTESGDHDVADTLPLPF